MPRTMEQPRQSDSRSEHQQITENHSSLRLLIQQVLSEEYRRVAPSKTPIGSTILLDISVDGIRCILLRKPAKESAEEGICLSPRELEISRLVAKGHVNKTIAAILEISTWTVGTFAGSSPSWESVHAQQWSPGFNNSMA
jgi:DNA-binding NarL/FixJ family response regulator